MHISRASAVGHLLALPLCLLPSPPALAADLDTVLALVPIVQAREYIADLDGILFAALLQPKLPSGIASTDGANARKLIKQLLKEAQLKDAAKFLVAAGKRAGQLDGKRLASAPLSSAVEGHAREAQERLTAILEFDAANSFKTDALGEPSLLMRPDELLFYHKALVGAREELDQVCLSFGAEERQEAATLAAKLAPTAKPVGAATNLPTLGDEGSGSWPYVVPGSRGYAGSLAARDAAIVQAIGALPSPVGTALTRSDLVRLANEEYQEQRSKGKAPTLPRPELPRPES